VLEATMNSPLVTGSRVRLTGGLNRTKRVTM
jgi:hypothetical protein